MKTKLRVKIGKGQEELMTTGEYLLWLSFVHSQLAYMSAAEAKISAVRMVRENSRRYR